MAYLFSSMEFLKVDDPAFRSMLIKLGIGQILLYGITFILLSTGKKINAKYKKIKNKMYSDFMF